VRPPSDRGSHSGSPGAAAALPLAGFITAIGSNIDTTFKNPLQAAHFKQNEQIQGGISLDESIAKTGRLTVAVGTGQSPATHVRADLHPHDGAGQFRQSPAPQ